MPDIDEYLRLREAQKSLHNKLLDSLPKGPKARKMLNRAAKELGYRVKDGAIIFDTEASMDRLFDFVLYEPDAGGRSMASRYLDMRPELPQEEELVLRSAVSSKSSLYALFKADRARGRLHLSSLVDPDDDCWIIDLELSRTITHQTVLFGRVFDVDGVCFSSGAPVCFDPHEAEFLLRKYHSFENVRNKYLRSRKRYGLFMQLAKGSRINIEYG